MPAGDGIRVYPDDLIVHARHLDGIADAVAVARQAGQTVRLGADAYGQLCEHAFNAVLAALTARAARLAWVTVPALPTSLPPRPRAGSGCRSLR